MYSDRRRALTDKVVEKSPTKKIYRSPELRIYGDIHRMTQLNTPIVGHQDNPHNPNKGTA